MYAHATVLILPHATGNSSVQLNFDVGKKNKIYHYSWKKHVKNSKIAKFGSEML